MYFITRSLNMDDKKTFTDSINELGSRIKAYFKDKNIEDVKNTKIIKDGLSYVQGAVYDVKKAVDSKNNKKLEKAIEHLTDVLKKKDLQVDVKAPVVNVPEPKVEVVKEVKEVKETNELLKKVLQSMMRKEADNSVYIQNRRPNEAMPVVLTEKSGKRFYDAVMMAVTSARSSSSGGGGVGSDVNVSEVGGNATSTNDGAVDAGTIRVTQANDVPVMVKGAQAQGAAITENPVLIAGENPSGNLSILQTAPDGDLIVHHHDQQVSLTDGASNSQYIPVNSTDSGFMATPILPYFYNGSTWDRLRGSAADGMTVNLGANNDVVVSGVSTEAKQDDLITEIQSLDGKDYATQTTLAALLAKVIAAPATEAKQDTGNTSLATIAGVDFATQTTLAAILAKLIAAPATEAKQDDIISALGGTSTTGTTSSVGDSATNVTLLASNANRKGATIYNDSTASLYVKLGATASLTDFTMVCDARGYFEVPYGYTGIIDGIWSSDAGGDARITELT